MIDRNNIPYITKLYEFVFDELVGNSKEFIIFVNSNNPHPLRIKVEDYITDTLAEDNIKINLDKLSDAYELDTFITSYIEYEYEQ